jgi:hypothetical protein
LAPVLSAAEACSSDCHIVFHIAYRLSCDLVLEEQRGPASQQPSFGQQPNMPPLAASCPGGQFIVFQSQAQDAVSKMSNAAC